MTHSGARHNPVTGRFETGTHTEPLPLDAPTAMPVDVSYIPNAQHRHDVKAAYLPGVLNDDADHIFRHGQCMALAVSIAQQNGWDDVAVGWVRNEPYEEYDEDETVDQENGVPMHVYAVRPDGLLIDVRGGVHFDAAERDYDGLRFYPVEDAEYVCGEFMSEQNYPFAESFVEPVMFRLATIEAMTQSKGDVDSFRAAINALKTA